MYVLYVLQLVKKQSQDEAKLNSEKTNTIALLIIELCLAEGIGSLIS